MSEKLDEQTILAYINDTPPLLSLLYDLDLMPEQLDRGSPRWDHMLVVAVAHKMIAAQRDRLLAAAKNVCARIRNNGYVFANGSPSALGEVRHDVVKYLEILQAAVKEVEDA